MAKRNSERPDSYFQLHHYMLKTDAWRALSAPARAVYVQIGSRYTGSNNGKIAFSSRDAASECDLARNTAMRAFKELVELGFIEETRHGALSRKTRIASEWRLTAFRCDLTGAFKTSLFMKRGDQARASRQSRSRSPTAASLAQTRASQTQKPGSNEGHQWLKTDTSLAQTRAGDIAEWLKREPVKPVFGGPPGSNEVPLIIYHPIHDPEQGAEAARQTPRDVLARGRS